MFDIKITKEPIILVDCSYYIFYRYFATSKWISFQSNSEEIDFLESFERHLENDLKKLSKKFKTIKSNIYFGVDCFRSTIWRNELLNCYKQNRVDNPNFNKNIFDYFKTILATKYKLKLISSDHLEADDVIALIHKQITNKINTIIITNDSDYVQLQNPNTIIVNMQLKDITIKHNIENYTIYKALTGDKSDNIKRVGKITKVNASNLIKKPVKEIYEWLEDNKLLNEFNDNMKLIDFNYIPENLANNLLSNINII
tara:strand:- start:3510 stop:4277 length:768 start_codon:yes stop_codon:yes gene_type:complete